MRLFRRLGLGRSLGRSHRLLEGVGGLLGGLLKRRSGVVVDRDGVGRGDRLDNGGGGSDGGGLDGGGHGVVERGRHGVNFRESVFFLLLDF